jgi:hypothetical protein
VPDRFLDLLKNLDGGDTSLSIVSSVQQKATK